MITKEQLAALSYFVCTHPLAALENHRTSVAVKALQELAAKPKTRAPKLDNGYAHRPHEYLRKG